MRELIYTKQVLIVAGRDTAPDQTPDVDPGKNLIQKRKHVMISL